MISLGLTPGRRLSATISRFSSMVCVAQRVQHAGHRVVRLPVIMRDTAGTEGAGRNREVRLGTLRRACHCHYRLAPQPSWRMRAMNARQRAPTCRLAARSRSVPSCETQQTAAPAPMVLPKASQPPPAYPPATAATPHRSTPGADARPASGIAKPQRNVTSTGRLRLGALRACCSSVRPLVAPPPSRGGSTRSV